MFGFVFVAKPRGFASASRTSTPWVQRSYLVQESSLDRDQPFVPLWIILHLDPGTIWLIPSSEDYMYLSTRKKLRFPIFLIGYDMYRTGSCPFYIWNFFPLKNQAFNVFTCKKSALPNQPPARYLWAEYTRTSGLKQYLSGICPCKHSQNFVAVIPQNRLVYGHIHIRITLTWKVENSWRFEWNGVIWWPVCENAPCINIIIIIIMYVTGPAWTKIFMRCTFYPLMH